MGDGGFRPVYNARYATEVESLRSPRNRPAQDRCVQRGEFAHLKALAEEKKRKQRRQIGPECDADAKSRLPVQVAGSICVVYRAMPAKFPKPISSQTLSLDAVRVTSFSPEVEGWLKRWASRQRRYLGPRPYSRAAR